VDGRSGVVAPDRARRPQPGVERRPLGQRCRRGGVAGLPRAGPEGCRSGV